MDLQGQSFKATDFKEAEPKKLLRKYMRINLLDVGKYFPKECSIVGRLSLKETSRISS